jgi:hypothetical protein
VSLTSLYNKLAGVEPRTSAAVVRHCAGRLLPVVEDLGPAPAWLPGFCLVVLDAATGLADCVFPCEDGHAQERALLGDVVAAVVERDLWPADRNSCVARFLPGIAARSGFFAIREHKQTRWEAVGVLRHGGRTGTGRVWEQSVEVLDDEGKQLKVRRATRVLDRPAGDGETEIVLLTNLPAQDADAAGMTRTLCYPRVALLGFCLGLVAMNVFAVLKAALRAVHGAEAAREVSGYYLADELSGTCRGMMIAIPSPEWEVFRGLTAAAFAGLLRGWAAKVRLGKFRRHRRGPKKPTPRRTYDKRHPHVSTARLLEQRKKGKPRRDSTP